MRLYYVTCSESDFDLLTSDFIEAKNKYLNILQELCEHKDGYIDDQEDFAYLYSIDSYDLIEKSIEDDNPYIEDYLGDERISKLLYKKGWEIDKEATKEYLEENPGRREYEYICREVDLPTEEGE